MEVINDQERNALTGRWRVLVTGAAGFIGSRVAQRLLEQGDAVTGLDNINDYYDPELKYGRLAELGIRKDSIEWFRFVQSEKYEDFTFVRMNLEDRQAMRLALDAANIESRPLWKPMHKQPVYRNSPAYVNGVCESLFRVGICLPSGPWVTDEHVRYIVDSIKDAIE